MEGPEEWRKRIPAIIEELASTRDILVQSTITDAMEEKIQRLQARIDKADDRDGDSASGNSSASEAETTVFSVLQGNDVSQLTKLPVRPAELSIDHHNSPVGLASSMSWQSPDAFLENEPVWRQGLAHRLSRLKQRRSRMNGTSATKFTVSSPSRADFSSPQRAEMRRILEDLKHGAADVIGPRDPDPEFGPINRSSFTAMLFAKSPSKFSTTGAYSSPLSRQAALGLAPQLPQRRRRAPKSSLSALDKQIAPQGFEGMLSKKRSGTHVADPRKPSQY
eukprot:NODE_3498_length_966_cov_34.278081_g3211_i0.p1 GENE.NODE_3498_length_966_cov_34.278081_g3211_i0~~NODE_3498_length_966_cov_34.278081_g3211_i0.p1  ORF type:complete len:278 (-),score=34.84 NODE_3498_length_966_cov_34.278081_g3211_i0:30-863(-)